MKNFLMKLLGFGGVPMEEGGNRLSLRNYVMFPLGTIGRDFLYNLFNGFLISFVLFTKHLDSGQFASITIIIIAARIFDALNDPIMGGIVENTRTKWGKYKPWQLIGAVLTGFVIVAVFCIPVDGWEFIGLLAAAYLLFSITFTMNDISYWGMMPTLTSHGDDRNKLTSLAQICAGAGGGLVGLIVPIFTAGALAFIGAVNAYRILAIVSVVLMVGFQFFTILGVKERPLDLSQKKEGGLKLKDIFKTIARNDQLLFSALVLLILSTGNSIVGGGLCLSYFYFEFGYEGGWFTTFGIGMSITSTLFTFAYPWLSQKFGRNKVLYFTLFCLIAGYGLMLVFGLAISTGAYLSTMWWVKFVLMALGYGVAGFGQGYYMIMVINIANTVEYNEWKTGKREEGLIFSLRPFTAKFSSALMQGIVSLVYIIAGVLTFTNQISDLENNMSLSQADKLEQISAITTSVPAENKMILLTCMCLIPIACIIVGLIIYKKKFRLDEKTLDDMMAEVAFRNEQDATMDGDVAEEIVF